MLGWTPRLPVGHRERGTDPALSVRGKGEGGDSRPSVQTIRSVFYGPQRGDLKRNAQFARAVNRMSIMCVVRFAH